MQRKSLVVIGVALTILVVVGGAYFASLPSGTTATTASTSSAELQYVFSLAYEHWMAIGNKNISLLMSQYSSGYEAVYFFINDSSIGPTNGRYDCNIPRGVNNCNYFPSNAWETIFNDTGAWNYTVCNANITSELDQRIVVLATVWYSLTQRNETLMVPYQMDFQYYNGTYAVWKEWFGLQQDPALVTRGIRTISCSG